MSLCPAGCATNATAVLNSITLIRYDPPAIPTSGTMGGGGSALGGATVGGYGDGGAGMFP